MPTTIASLALIVETFGIDQAIGKLDDFIDTAGKAETAANKLSAAAASAGENMKSGAKGIAEFNEEAGKTADVVKDSDKAHAGAKKSADDYAKGIAGLASEAVKFTRAMKPGENPLLQLAEQSPQILESLGSMGVTLESVSGALGGLGVTSEAAMGALGAAAGPAGIAVGAVAAGVAGAFALAANEINKSSGDITAGLGLTAEQLAQVKDKTVTMGDVFQATLDVVGGKITQTFGPGLDWVAGAAGKAFGFVGEVAGKVFQGIADFVGGVFNFLVEKDKFVVTLFIGGWLAIINTAKTLFSGLPSVVAEFAVDAINFVLGAIEGLINKSIAGINVVIELVNRVAGHKVFDTLADVQIGRVEQKWQGAGKAMGGALVDGISRAQKDAESAVGKIFAAPANMAKKFVGEVIDTGVAIGDEAVEIRQGKIVDQGRHLPKTKTVLANDNDVHGGSVRARVPVGLREVAGAAKEAREEVEKLNEKVIDFTELESRPTPALEKELEEWKRANQIVPTPFAVAPPLVVPSNPLGEGAVLRPVKTLEFTVPGADAQKRLADQIQQAFSGGVQAALKGDLDGFLKTTLGSIASSMFKKAFEGVGTSLARNLGGGLGIGGGLASGLIGIGATLLSGLLGGGNKVVGEVHLAAKDQQALQGVGTVLGSAKEQSHSIADSLSTAAKYQNHDLQIGNLQVAYLKAINANIAGLTAALGRQIGVDGGALDTAKLGLGTKGKKGLLGLIGASSTTTSLIDQGVNLGSGTLQDFVGGRVAGNYYQDTQTVKTKSGFFGIGGGTVTTNRELTSGIGDDVMRSVGKVFSSIGKSVVEAASTLGIKGAQAILDGFQIEIGRISLEGLSAGQITEQLNAVFSKAGDQLAAAVAPSLLSLQDAGEGAFETLQRLATEYTTVDAALASIGRSFGAIGLASVAARDDLVKLFDGLDGFTSATQFFAENFLSEAERMGPIQKSVADRLAELGLSGVTTKNAFKDLVLGLDLTTEGNRKLYADLLELAPAFAKVADYADAARSSLVEKIQNSYDSLTERIQQTIDKFKQFATDLAKFRGSLDAGQAAMLSPEQRYLASQARFRSVSSAAAGGNEEALGELQSVSQEYLDVSKDYYATSEQYFSNLEEVKKSVETAEGAALKQVDTGQQQLQQLKDMVAGIIDVKDSVDDVQSGIGALAQLVATANNLATAMDPKWGALQNVAVNRELARVTGYTGNFGKGGFSEYIDQQPLAIRSLARDVLVNAGQSNRVDFGTTDSHWGDYHNIEANKALAAATGYIDAFGNNRWQSWIVQQPEAIKAAARAILVQFNQADRIAFANGGYHLGGLRLVGERGPELEATGPARYWSNSQTRAMLGSNDNSRIEALLGEVLDELRADKTQRGEVGMQTLVRLEEVVEEVRGVKRQTRASAA